MRLTVLLNEASKADPQHRIEWRDPIASFGERAIAGVQPWLAEPALSAFAVRVIERVGEQGKAELATRALRAARHVVPPRLQGDLDWALGRLRTFPPLASPAQRARPRATSENRGRSPAPDPVQVVDLGVVPPPAEGG
jgi:hypothetical protein